jgi:hypothetical protein
LSTTYPENEGNMIVNNELKTAWTEAVVGLLWGTAPVVSDAGQQELTEVLGGHSVFSLTRNQQEAGSKQSD